jgi:hypothetical protein
VFQELEDGLDRGVELVARILREVRMPVSSR